MKKLIGNLQCNLLTLCKGVLKSLRLICGKCNFAFNMAGPSTTRVVSAIDDLPDNQLICIHNFIITWRTH